MKSVWIFCVVLRVSSAPIWIWCCFSYLFLCTFHPGLSLLLSLFALFCNSSAL
ncbi:hypothetical protein BD779DRAFT_1532282, partial [Infundibulicybe gibba]